MLIGDYRRCNHLGHFGQHGEGNGGATELGAFHCGVYNAPNAYPLCIGGHFQTFQRAMGGVQYGVQHGADTGEGYWGELVLGFKYLRPNPNPNPNSNPNSNPNPDPNPNPI